MHFSMAERKELPFGELNSFIVSCIRTCDRAEALGSHVHSRTHADSALDDVRRENGERHEVDDDAHHEVPLADVVPH